jgi:hypothetical protein
MARILTCSDVWLRRVLFYTFFSIYNGTGSFGAKGVSGGVVINVVWGCGTWGFTQVLRYAVMHLRSCICGHAFAVMHLMRNSAHPEAVDFLGMRPECRKTL